MKIKRIFTKAGQSPLEGISFIRRCSKISKPDGSVVFENDNVVVPESWSQTAVDILAQKYFRRRGVNHNHANSLYNSKYSHEWASKLDHPNGIGHENDIRQTAHRIAGCWASWGETCGYFTTEKDAQAFYDEMIYLLSLQYLAPNSPQWFNTGLFWAYGIDGEPQGHYYVDEKGDLVVSGSAYERPQPHACFIQGVKDDLVNPGGIFDLFHREARLFKYGSGTGSNFSSLRAQGETLSGGGKSSGLMSWLKVGDVGAGGVKSGGTTRRAAKMVVLNADHPDVEQFINWKVDEERKVVALAAGSQLVRKVWEEIRAAYNSPEAPKELVSRANPKENKELAKALSRAKRLNVPGAFLGQCLNRLIEGDLTDDIKLYDLDWEGEGYQTVSGMNANNTIRVTDGFMHSVKKNADWDLTLRTTGEVSKTLKAKKLFDQINRASFLCADPGLQFDTTINDWHTCPVAGRINASNPCSEYMFLDDTACNLASANLVKFLKEDGEFDVEGYRHACRLTTIALEISVTMAQFPGPEIADLSYKYRTLGLGYANLGAMLMRLGLPYDSEMGRNWAAAVTAIMTGESYLASSEMAQELGPFPGYEANRDEMLRVMRNHRAAAYNGESGYEKVATTPVGLKPIYRGPRRLVNIGRDLWDKVVAAGEQYGYRNAQATCLAPTGTIGLLMDCDTTGGEPDFALLKYKKLAGGGYFKIVNQSVSPALKNLGYSEDEIATIANYIEETGTIEGAPGLKDADLPVFDCATKCGVNGTRFIAPRGHIEMMAAQQPFISGAISKTVNMPSNSTIQDIHDIHMLAWELGLKAIALYRDGSKMSQALATNMQLLEGLDDAEIDTLTDETASLAARAKVLATAMARGYRKCLPNRRSGFVQKAKVGGHSMYIHTGEYEDGTVGEIFIDVSREGATLRSLLNCFAVAVSLGLQYGVPLEEFVDAFTFTKFEPAGMVGGSDYIRNATSVVDYVFRELAVTYLDRYDLAHIKPDEKLKKPKKEEPVAVSEADVAAAGKHFALTHKKLNAIKEARDKGFTGNSCTACGSMQMVRSGTCEKCNDCGQTTGCS